MAVKTKYTSEKKKHGVVITEHRKWNTKKIYNEGYLMRAYRHQPKHLRFKSAMVNDRNQHLCGGWTMRGQQDTNAIICDQLIAGRKPLGVAVYLPEDLDSAKRQQKRLLAAGLVVSLKRRAWIAGRYVWDLAGCQDLLIRDIGNLDDLAKDYLDAGIELDDVHRFGGRHLKTRMHCFDIPESPLWLTGLVLGYPVENTISIYREQCLS
jgi:hypothetical protein